ncbi:MAG: hypothetical protein Ct9H300mP8_10410 [Gammaproteobacteria bacterium]|nr:MAG: hypothetical protein Ct9H300mP8_10410 [Gammaproteobacteria bacterium]
MTWLLLIKRGMDQCNTDTYPNFPHAFAYQPSTATDDLSVEVLAFIRRHIAET